MRWSHVVPVALAAVGLSSSTRSAQSSATECLRTVVQRSASPSSSSHRADDERTYRLFVPPSYDGRSAPARARPARQRRHRPQGQAGTSRFEALAAREGFVVATLQAGAEGNRWNVPLTDARPDDVRYVSDVIDHVAARVCTDTAARLCDGLFGRRADVVAARVQAQRSHCGDRADGGAALAGSVRRAGDSRADVPRSRRSAEHLRRPRRGSRRRVGRERARGARGMGEAQRLRRRRGARRSAGTAVDAQLFRLPHGRRSGSCASTGSMHRWARDEVDATQAMWEFFRTQHCCARDDSRRSARVQLGHASLNIAERALTFACDDVAAMRLALKPRRRAFAARSLRRVHARYAAYRRRSGCSRVACRADGTA